MAKYANQESVTIGKREVRDKEHPYCMMNLQAVQDALTNIRSVGGIKMWVYLNNRASFFHFLRLHLFFSIIFFLP